jgi:hypothetical protein
VPHNTRHLYSQEINSETYAIAKAGHRLPRNLGECHLPVAGRLGVVPAPLGGETFD